MIEQNKNRFVNIFTDNIKREGSDKLLEWLLKSDFFVAPASTKFHSACEGGLCRHSLAVYDRFLTLLKCEYGDTWEEKIPAESVAVIALLHDVCKVNFYRVDYRNVKVDGVWEQKPIFVVNDQLPYGHGEKSVYILSGFMRLTRDEAMAINWHMGGFDQRVRGGSYSMSEAFFKYPLTLLFHAADLMTTYLDENDPV